MLRQEAKWFGRSISNIGASKVYPMCNVGSSTKDFRKEEQPWIDEFIFAPARAKGDLVRHLDITDAPGVDIVGDLTDARFLETLSKIEFRSVFCSNLLEHVFNREDICNVLTARIPAGGDLFVSCPFRFPYHPDPIDTLYRPDVEELASMFPGTRVCAGQVVTCGSYLDYIGYRGLIKRTLRMLVPFYRPKGWLRSLEFIPLIPWLFRRFQATCLVLRKESYVA